MIRTHYVSHDAEKAKRACLYCYYGCSRRCLGRYFITSFVTCIDATVAFRRFYYGHGDRVEERKQVRIAHVLSQNTHRRRLRSRNSFCLFLRYFTEPSWTRKPLWCSRYHFIPMMKACCIRRHNRHAETSNIFFDLFVTLSISVVLCRSPLLRYRNSSNRTNFHRVRSRMMLRKYWQLLGCIGSTSRL